MILIPSKVHPTTDGGVVAFCGPGSCHLEISLVMIRFMPCDWRRIKIAAISFRPGIRWCDNSKELKVHTVNDLDAKHTKVYYLAEDLCYQ